jgi:predicted deacetylase
MRSVLLDRAARAASVAPKPRTAGERRLRERRSIAVALHDIEPATYERCALIRDWLDDHGVDRATLLVIPARDLHPLGERSPEMTSWLAERVRAGDCLAQHGFRHERLRPLPLAPSTIAVRHRQRSAEFVGLDSFETRRSLEAGWRVLKLAGLEPEGFVAPAYAYTPALLAELPRRFRWWADRLQLHLRRSGSGHGSVLAPAWDAGERGAWRRALSPALVRAGGLCGGRTLRLDVHPADLENPRHMLALEYVLHRAARRREAITYDELLRDPRLNAQR